jgi:glycosyltransferase involved in cell wall biosynthesis
MRGQKIDIPRVLIVDISDNFGGANARVLALMKKLPRDKVGLATLMGSRIAPELEALGYDVHKVADNKFDPRIPIRLMKITREFGYQLIDTQNPNSKLWGSIAAFYCQLPLISTLNSWYMNEHPRFSARWLTYSAVELMTNFSLKRYIVVSRQIYDDLIKLGIPADKIDLIYNAVQLDSSRIKGNKKQFLEKYGWPDNAVICFAAGRLVWAKAHDDLISAMAAARKKNPNLYCVIAGEGVLYNQLSKQIIDLGLEGSVILAGHLEHEELLSILKVCDIYVMPSRTEGTPVALLEAAMLSRPIIASNVGGIPELVSNEEQALFIDKGDIMALSNSLLRIAGDYEMASRLGHQARVRIETSFSLEVQSRATVESYKKACR